jgi:hypothetical protein
LSRSTGLGDLASIAGLIVAAGGFAFTLYGVHKTKTAAERAEQAARTTRDSVRLLDTVVDFSAAISILEEIKRLHRATQWSVLPDRYTALRKILVALRTSNPKLSDGQRTTIQNAVSLGSG